MSVDGEFLMFQSLKKVLELHYSSKKKNAIAHKYTNEMSCTFLQTVLAFFSND
jgi:NAD-dependent DNA ligase